MTENMGDILPLLFQNLNLIMKDDKAVNGIGTTAHSVPWPWWLIVDVNSVLWFLHRVDVGDIADVSEARAAYLQGQLHSSMLLRVVVLN
jgi:hypothetical protein